MITKLRKIRNKFDNQRKTYKRHIEVLYAEMFLSQRYMPHRKENYLLAQIYLNKKESFVRSICNTVGFVQDNDLAKYCRSA